MGCCHFVLLLVTVTPAFACACARTWPNPYGGHAMARITLISRLAVRRPSARPSTWYDGTGCKPRPIAEPCQPGPGLLTTCALGAPLDPLSPPSPLPRPRDTSEHFRFSAPNGARPAERHFVFAASGWGHAVLALPYVGPALLPVRRSRPCSWASPTRRAKQGPPERGGGPFPSTASR